MSRTQKFSTAVGTLAVLVAVGGWAEAAFAFGISRTTGSFDNVTLTNGTLVGSDGVEADSANKVKFLEDVNGTNENQVRWGTGFGSYEWQQRTGTKNYAYDYQREYVRRGTTKWSWNGHEFVEKTIYRSGYYWTAKANDIYEHEYTYNQKVYVAPTYEDQSGLGFEGVTDLEVSLNDVFNVGTLKHFNETILGDDLDGSTTDFAMSLDFSSLGLGEQTFNFALNIDETNNDASAHDGGVCPYQTEPGQGCSDQITWDFDLETANKFTYDGDEYTLELVGFSQSEMDAANLTEEFISQEGGTSEAGLWAKIVKLNTVDPGQEIPEPSALISIAALGGYLAKSRRKREQQLAA